MKFEKIVKSPPQNIFKKKNPDELKPRNISKTKEVVEKNMRLNYYKKVLLQRHKTQKLGRKRLTDFDSIKIKNPRFHQVRQLTAQKKIYIY